MRALLATKLMPSLLQIAARQAVLHSLPRDGGAPLRHMPRAARGATAVLKPCLTPFKGCRAYALCGACRGSVVASRHMPVWRFRCPNGDSLRVPARGRSGAHAAGPAHALVFALGGVCEGLSSIPRCLSSSSSRDHRCFEGALDLLLPACNGMHARRSPTIPSSQTQA